MYLKFGGHSIFGFGDFASFSLQANLAKFPFQPMDYSPWSPKNLIDRNWLEKFMQVAIAVTCMYINFGGCSSSSFGAIVHGHQKIQSIGISSKNSCKYGLMPHACTPILVGVVSPVLEILLPSKMAKFPFLTMGYSPWSSKNLINRNRLKKFMQIGIDVTCMYTNFGGWCLSGFRDTATFKNSQISLSDHGL